MKTTIREKKYPPATLNTIPRPVSFENTMRSTMGRTGKRAYHLGAAHSALWGNASSDTTGNSETFLSRWRFQSAPTMPAHTMVMAPTGKAYWMKNVAASGAPSIMPSTSTANGLPGPMTTLQPTKNASMMLMGLMPAATSVGNKTPRHTTNVPMALGRMSMSTNAITVEQASSSTFDLILSTGLAKASPRRWDAPIAAM